MTSFAKKCIYASLSVTYAAAVTEHFQVRHEERVDRADRATQLFLEWTQRLRPQAELAAQFYLTEPSDRPSKKPRKVRDTRQRHFYEDTFFSTVDFFRRAGEDIALKRVNAGELSNYLGPDARRWLPVLESQQPKWDGARAMQIAQAIAGLKAIIGEDDRANSTPDWQALELVGTYEIVERRADALVLAVQVANPNPIASPVAALYVSSGGPSARSLVCWPDNVDTISAFETAWITIAVPNSDVFPGLHVRFARACEQSAQHPKAA